MLEERAATLRTLLLAAPSLYDVAAQSPGARALSGRGTAYVLTVNDEPWFIRHYRRGGAIAPILGDRYLRAANRAEHELRVSESARARGIPTPRVFAAIEYPAGIFARYDIAMEFIPDSYDLADALFNQQGNAGDVARAAALIRNVVARGMVHADLNLKNILLTSSDAWIIDLDRCSMTPGRNPGAAHLMRRRFIRSLKKWEALKGREVARAVTAELDAAFYA